MALSSTTLLITLPSSSSLLLHSIISISYLPQERYSLSLCRCLRARTDFVRLRQRRRTSSSPASLLTGILSHSICMPCIPHLGSMDCCCVCCPYLFSFPSVMFTQLAPSGSVLSPLFSGRCGGWSC